MQNVECKMQNGGVGVADDFEMIAEETVSFSVVHFELFVYFFPNKPLR